MKYSESWLREWINSTLTREELANQLTMGGLEVEEIEPVAEAVFSGIVIGQIIKVEQHPNAPRLTVCQVSIGGKQLQIVCGATNARLGLKTAVAMIDAKLPNKPVISSVSIQDIESQGMLCSGADLELSDEGQGLLELPHDAPLGYFLWDYLKLTDYVFDVSITPNRGDCLSIRGLAREISALTNTPISELTIPEIKSTVEDKLPLTVHAKAEAPRYVGRIIRHIKSDLPTPTWLKERLRRSGIRSISPVVDVTNYVMLELGQPMHAFDLKTIDQEIVVRHSKAGEKLTLLDGTEVELNSKTLLIADQTKPLAIAGVMGGSDSSVTLLTTDIFLESAYFLPEAIARQRQHYGLNSDSAYRFERGVDPTFQREAIERATQLILEMLGGEAGPIIENESVEHLPPPTSIFIPKEKIPNILGIDIPVYEIVSIFNRLRFKTQSSKTGWTVLVPPYRFDLRMAEDIVEEIARIYGYQKIPTHRMHGDLEVSQPLSNQDQLSMTMRQALLFQNYHEIISYSFIDKKLQTLLDPDNIPQELINPITAEMTVMRTNLWPGLIHTLLYNKSRQQQRIRIFELGTCFIADDKHILQLPKIGGLISGSVYPEQWGMTTREIDFYDLKGDVENLLKSVDDKETIEFRPAIHKALHPGQTAGIYYQEQQIGFLGALHPHVLQALDLSNNVYVFEIDLSYFKQDTKHRFHEISKFPEIRRDIAILVNQTVPAKAIQDTIKKVAGDWLKDVFIFDVYHGKGISPDLKSMALALIWQNPERTLVDDEVLELMQRVITTLKVQLGAELRS